MIYSCSYPFVYNCTINEVKMEFIEKLIGDILVFKSINHTANIRNAQAFKKLALERIEEGQKKIIVDLSDVSLLDSTFLGALVVVYRKIISIGGNLKICGSNESIFTLLGLTKLDKTFETFLTLDDTVNSF